MGTLESVDRVVAGRSIPECHGRRFRTAGVGANVRFEPEHLLQLGVRGRNLYRLTFEPQLARRLLSVGEEEIKGNELTRARLRALQGLPVHFFGNVEGGDLFSARCDVIVWRRIVGNIALNSWARAWPWRSIKFFRKTYKSAFASQWAYLFRRGRAEGHQFAQCTTRSRGGGGGGGGLRLAAPLIRAFRDQPRPVSRQQPSRTQSASPQDLRARVNGEKRTRSSP